MPQPLAADRISVQTNAIVSARESNIRSPLPKLRHQLRKFVCDYHQQVRADLKAHFVLGGGFDDICDLFSVTASD